MKRILAVASIGAFAAIGLTAPVATAAPMQRPATATAPAGTDHVDAYRWHSWHYNEAECRSRGAAGSRQGVWTGWYCQRRSGATTWDLFVDDRCRICVGPTRRD